MATYNTLPTVSEDALINEPKAPQNRKAIAIVAAVCFASASVGALVQPQLGTNGRISGKHIPAREKNWSSAARNKYPPPSPPSK